MKKILFPILFLILLIPAILSKQDNSSQQQTIVDHPRTYNTTHRTVMVNDHAIRQAVQNQRSGVMVQSQGQVSRILPDDNDGSRHQKFIIKLSNNRTVLFAHNIDLAPRINSLKIGDVIESYGQYEWNEKGGVVHWTHHDPANRHPHGWINHNGRTYQ